jgi:putative salt-induced outer membrane protein YdiY
MAVAALGAAALIAFSGSAFAQDEPPKPTRFTANFGYVQTSGNTDVVTISAGDKLEHDTGKWKLKQEAAAVWGETSGIETAGKYLVGVQANYQFHPRMSAYALAGWRRDVFAGIRTEYNEGVGLAYNAIKPAPQQLDFEFGVGLTQRDATVGPDDDFTNARFATVYAYDFPNKSRFDGTAVYRLNLDDSDDSDASLRLALAAPLATNIALKFGYDLFYRNQPLPGFEKTDTTISAGIQVTI